MATKPALRRADAERPQARGGRAKSVKADNAIGAHAAQIYEQFTREFESSEDFSAVINMVRKHSKSG